MARQKNLRGIALTMEALIVALIATAILGYMLYNIIYEAERIERVSGISNIGRDVTIGVGYWFFKDADTVSALNDFVKSVRGRIDINNLYLRIDIIDGYTTKTIYEVGDPINANMSDRLTYISVFFLTKIDLHSMKSEVYAVRIITSGGQG